MCNSVLYSIKVGGKNVSVFNIKNVIEGIVNNVFYQNYEIHLSIENSANFQVIEYLKSKSFNKNIKLIFHTRQSWYEWLIYSFKEANNFEYLITLHDDTYFRTKNFDRIFIDELKNIDNLGAFSFIDDGYLRGFFNPQLRGAFHIDRIYENARANGIEYEYHLQKPNWHKKNLKLKKILNKLGIDKTKEGEFEYEKNKVFNFLSAFFYDPAKIDFPQKKIKVHSLWTNIMGFRSKNLKSFDIIDLDISHGVFADEDICLSTQINDLVNILVPSVHYYHDRDNVITRSWKDIKKDYDKVSTIFHQKWKIYPLKLENVNIEERESIINFLDKEYNGKVTWTKSLNSYDWIYI